MKIIFRADGDSATGLGHIMRMSALISILQPYFECEIWTKNPEFFPVSDFIEMPHIQKIMAEEILEEADFIARQKTEQSIIVLDGYQFITEYQSILKNGGWIVVCIDDIKSYHFVADVIINHAGGISKEEYSREAYTKLYLGPEYALVKPLFNQKQNFQSDLNNMNILISLGAADPNNNTDDALGKVISSAKFNEIHVLTGAANKHFEFLKTKYSLNTSLSFYQNKPARFIYDLMLRCPYAVLTPSTICYEYMSINGVVYLYQIADNQKNIQKYFIQKRMAFLFQDLEAISEEDMIFSLRQQKQVFDRKSGERLLNIFFDLHKKINAALN